MAVPLFLFPPWDDKVRVSGPHTCVCFGGRSVPQEKNSEIMNLKAYVGAGTCTILPFREREKELGI